jgi:Peptidase_C39 like family
VVRGKCIALLVIAGLPGVVLRDAPMPRACLKVEFHAQETERWCWASSGQMVMGYHGESHKQCDLAKKAFGKNCCQSPMPNGCDAGGWVVYNDWDFDSNKTNSAPLDWDVIVKEIDNGRPFTFTWSFAEGYSHTMVCIGYSNKTKEIIYHDPAPANIGSPNQVISYAKYKEGVTAEGVKYTHWDDYYQILPKKP